MSRVPLLGGRYELCAQIGAGGMATVHLGKLRGARDFSRVVAIKRLFPHLASDREVVAMFLDEARLASRVEHPNVVRVSDVVGGGDEIFLVMDYVPGVTLAELVKAQSGEPVPLSAALSIMHDALAGLSAAHRATSQGGQPLKLVHRDVSPQNLLIGADGITRVLDFGIAKADGRLQERTRTNETKGKLAYMAPEQLLGEPIDERTDIYAAGVCLWELATGKRAYAGSDAHVMRQVVEQALPPATASNSALPSAFDALIERATAKEASARFGSAAEMIEAIEALDVERASRSELSALLAARAGDALAQRAKLVAQIEASEHADAEPSAEVVADDGVAVEAPSRPGRSSSKRWLVAMALLLSLVGAAFVWRLSQAAVGGAAPSAEAPPPSAAPVAPLAPSVVPAETTPAATSAPPEPEPSSKRPQRPTGPNRRETLY